MNLNYLAIGIFIICVSLITLSACGDIGQKLEDNLDAINRTVDGLDSLANDKMDRVEQLDTLINTKMDKLQRIDSVVNRNRSRLDSLGITN